MAVPIEVVFDSRKAEAALYALSGRQFAFARALALTHIGQFVKGAEQMEMRRVFDRPTPFTVNSLRLTPATRERAEAKVWFRQFGVSFDEHYLVPQVYGGARKFKRFEQHLQRAGILPAGHFLIPAKGAQLDAYGNVARSVYSRILAQLQAAHDPYQRETATSRARQRGGTPRYFYGNPHGKGEGIWQRSGFGFGSSIRPVFITAKRAPTYTKRFAFYQVAQDQAQLHYAEELNHAVDFTLRTAR